MSKITSILKNVTQTILSARTGTGASSSFALPPISSVITWQTTFGVAPAAVNITLRVSNDNVNWTVLDTTTAVGGETRTTAQTSAKFLDANVVTNTGDVAITLTVSIKPVS